MEDGNRGNQPAAAGEQRNLTAAAAVDAPQPTDTHLFLALSVTTCSIWFSAWVLATPIYSINFMFSGWAIAPPTSSIHFATLVLGSFLVACAIDVLFFCGVQMLRSPQNSNQNLLLEHPQKPPSAGQVQNPSTKSWLTKDLADEDVSQFVGFLMQFLALIVTSYFISVSAWLLANLIKSKPDFKPLVPVSVVVALAIDVLFFFCVGVQMLRSSQNNSQNLQLEQPQKVSPAGQIQNPRKKGWLTKDLCDMISLFVGLGILQHLKVIISFTSFVLWISCLARVIICFLILNHPEDYGFIDLFIALLTQGAFYAFVFNKTKRIILLLLIFIFCVGLVILRNRLRGRRGSFSSLLRVAEQIHCVGLVF